MCSYTLGVKCIFVLNASLRHYLTKTGEKDNLGGRNSN